MEGEARLVAPQALPEEREERALRPRSFDAFVGQPRVVNNLQTWIKAAQRAGRPLDHVLLTGPPGLGKTTLAHLIARSLDARLVTTSGPVLEKISDLAGMLVKLKRGDVLFVDEVHRMRTSVEEYLYSAMEDCRIDVPIDDGIHARTLSVSLQRFTLVGATTRAGLLTKPFRDRFGIQERLVTYAQEELEEIVRRSAKVLGVGIDDEAAALVAGRARGTPRIANRLLARLRDVALADGAERIDARIAARGLRMLGIDAEGLEALDRQILAILAESPYTPVGIKTLAVATGEEVGTIEDVYEPYLIVRGFVRKTARGRVLGPRGFALLGIEPRAAGDDPQGTLFP
ncbi:MAG: Holliday junction branch migration DNA helicase RuvB [Planctomycetota bacterium]|nr:MAG: Holliday junction branch migration DNA helicase RuvB [Planctomycetota bacterium]